MSTAPALCERAVTVVVPTYRRPALLSRVVAAMEAQTLPADRFEVVIVDNGSDDETWEVLAELASAARVHVRPLRIDENRGPARARNLGWREARGRYVAYTDDDCVPDPSWLARGVAALDAAPHVGVVQGATLKPAGHHVLGDWTAFREVVAPSWAFEGCNLFFRREALAAGGGFDEEIYFGGEDTVAGWSTLEAGWERLFEEGAVVRHDLVERGLRWHAKMAWRDRNLVHVAAHHPRFRQEGMWRPWALNRQCARFGLAVLGLAAAPWRPVGLVLAVPWIRAERAPSIPGDPRRPWRVVAVRALLEGVRLAGTLSAAVPARRFIL